jgi:UDP-N-acetylmuramoylalanine--D-glutamate ligase
MIKNNSYAIIIGLGKTGYSCARYLIKQGYQIAIADSRLTPPNLEQFKQEFPNVKIYLGKFDYAVLSQADELIISPGISNQEPVIAACIDAGVPVISDIEIFASNAKAPIVAITGSNGKSTVTSLVGQMAQDTGKKVKIGGNLGTPVLDLLDPEAELYVLELSSFQLENTYSLQPAAAVVLNISPDHMDRYLSLAEYIAAKQRIYTNCQVAVINLDDPVSYQGAELSKPNLVVAGFSLRSSKETQAKACGYQEFGKQIKYYHAQNMPPLKIKGLHNLANALAALALGEAIGLPQASMRQTLQEFPGLEHRCQWVANINQVDWYNDSKGTNIGATKSAIEGLGADNQGKIIIILGGLGKDADFTQLQAVVKQYVRTAVLIGKDAKLIEQALHGTCKIMHANSMPAAVKICFNEACPHDIVLLSPACASFDMFNNFEERGEIFTKEVQKLLY